ncbi:Hypothetical_protein [Hexamita inflata]|uniref:Hypothetical_protein n=1 Tax=Hexamita inflata TaxID=28002 RepID=A0AA86N4N3_9EUKA|nr:Hypothetical protein HINF_LOCUS403 [Hexamita inflata]
MNTTAKISDITINIFEEWKTTNVNKSGSIIGQSVQSQNTIKTICFTEHLTSNTYFTYFGLFGYHNGTISICNIQQNFIILQGNFTCFGTLGVVEGQNCVIYNVQTTIQIPSNNSGTYVGILSSFMLAENWSVTNITISNSHIYSQLLTGLISYINSGAFSEIYIYNSTANSSGQYNWALSGGLYADSKGYSAQNTLQNTTVNQCYFENNSLFTNNSVIQASSGGLIGDSQDNQIRICNVLLKLCHLSSYGSATQTQSSGLIAFLYDTVIEINNVQVSHIILDSENLNIAFEGGFIGQSRNYTININNSKVSNILITISGTPFRVGILFSETPSVLTATGLSSDGANIINGAAVNNCGNIQSVIEQNGC